MRESLHGSPFLAAPWGLRRRLPQLAGLGLVRLHRKLSLRVAVLLLPLLHHCFCVQPMKYRYCFIIIIFCRSFVFFFFPNKWINHQGLGYLIFFFLKSKLKNNCRFIIVGYKESRLEEVKNRWLLSSCCGLATLAPTKAGDERERGEPNGGVRSCERQFFYTILPACGCQHDRVALRGGSGDPRCFLFCHRGQLFCNHASRMRASETGQHIQAAVNK